MGSLESYQACVNRSSELSLKQAFKTKIDLKKKLEGFGRGGSSMGIMNPWRKEHSSQGRGRGMANKEIMVILIFNLHVLIVVKLIIFRKIAGIKIKIIMIKIMFNVTNAINMAI